MSRIKVSNQKNIPNFQMSNINLSGSINRINQMNNNLTNEISCGRKTDFNEPKLIEKEIN